MGAVSPQGGVRRSTKIIPCQHEQATATGKPTQSTQSHVNGTTVECIQVWDAESSCDCIHDKRRLLAQHDEPAAFTQHSSRRTQSVCRRRAQWALCPFTHPTMHRDCSSRIDRSQLSADCRQSPLPGRRICRDWATSTAQRNSLSRRPFRRWAEKGRRYSRLTSDRRHRIPASFHRRRCLCRPDRRFHSALKRTRIGSSRRTSAHSLNRQSRRCNCRPRAPNPL